MLERDELEKRKEEYTQTSETTDVEQEQKAIKAFQLAEAMDTAEEPVTEVIKFYRDVIRLSEDQELRASAMHRVSYHLERIIEYQRKNIEIPQRYQGISASATDMRKMVRNSYEKILSISANDELKAWVKERLGYLDHPSYLPSVQQEEKKQKGPKKEEDKEEKRQATELDTSKVTIVDLAGLALRAVQDAKKEYDIQSKPKKRSKPLLNLLGNTESTKVNELLARMESFYSQANYPEVIKCMNNYFMDIFKDESNIESLLKRWETDPIFGSFLLKQFENNVILANYFQLNKYHTSSYSWIDEAGFGPVYRVDSIVSKMKMLLEQHAMVAGLADFKSTLPKAATSFGALFQQPKDSSEVALSPEQLKDALQSVVFQAKEQYCGDIDKSSWFHDLHLLQYSAYRKLYSFCYSLYHSDLNKTIEASLDLNTKKAIGEFNAEISSMYTQVIRQGETPTEQQKTEIASRIIVAFAQRLLQQDYLSKNSFGTYLVKECLKNPKLVSYLGLEGLTGSRDHIAIAREKIITKGRDLLLANPALQELPKSRR